MKSKFVVIADRGHLKAFRSETPVPGRPPRLALVETVDLTAGFQRLSEKLEDNAGRFPVGAGPSSGSGGGNGRHQNSIGEKHHDLEETRRITKDLAHRITELLQQQNSPSWSFAAPTAIKDAVVEELGKSERGRLEESVAADLVKVPIAELAGYFQKL